MGESEPILVKRASLSMDGGEMMCPKPVPVNSLQYECINLVYIRMLIMYTNGWVAACTYYWGKHTE